MALSLSLSLSAVWWHHVLAWEKKGGCLGSGQACWATMARGIRDVW